MSGKVYLITGANRGIGYELAKKLAIQGNTVIATTRNPETSTELTKLSKEHENVHIVTLDVSSIASIEQLDSQLAKVASDGIDVLISNAGAGGASPIISSTYELWESLARTNTFGPVFVTKVAYPYLLKKKTRQIFFISSSAGSLTGFMSFEVSPYGASKAALNYAALAFAAELKPEDFTVVAIHPGVVQTDMLKSAEEAFDEQNLAWIKSVSITVENCADNLLDVFKNATKEISGKFLGNDGVEVPL